MKNVYATEHQARKIELAVLTVLPNLNNISYFL